MNDKDKEAFDNWFDKIEIKWDLEEAWKAACEYKQSEIDKIELREAKSNRGFVELASKFCKLQAENVKLRECLEFTTHAAEYLYKPDVKLNRGMSPTFYFTLTYEGDLELMEKTKRARQVLKELEDK